MHHSFTAPRMSLTAHGAVVQHAGLCSLLVVVALSGCQCNITRDDLSEIPEDEPPPVEEPGPPPPQFPLKAGDRLRFPALGGRTATCDNATVGACDRALSAEYNVIDVALDNNNRWAVTADVAYRGSSDKIEAAAIAPLILENVAPFSSVTAVQPSETSGVVFSTNKPPTAALNALGFPFFQYDPDNIDVFEAAGQEFCDAWSELDPEANCEVQFGDQKMEVYFKSTSAEGPTLHTLRAEFHQMGFMCGWNEAIIPFDEGMTRDQRAFQNAGTPELAAIFMSPMVLTRDGVDYRCTCFSQTCKAGNGAEATCLSRDPDAEPGPCE